jgi:hypothetical protein
MGQSFSAIRQSLKRKREPESEDQNEARKVLVVQDPNNDGTVFKHLKNSNPRIQWMIGFNFRLSNFNYNPSLFVLALFQFQY